MYEQLMQEIFAKKNEIHRNLREPECIILSSDYIDIMISYLRANLSLSNHYDLEKVREEAELRIFGLPVYEVENKRELLKVF